MPRTRRPQDGWNVSVMAVNRSSCRDRRGVGWRLQSARLFSAPRKTGLTHSSQVLGEFLRWRYKLLHCYFGVLQKNRAKVVASLINILTELGACGEPLANYRDWFVTLYWPNWNSLITPNLLTLLECIYDARALFVSLELYITVFPGISIN